MFTDVAHFRELIKEGVQLWDVPRLQQPWLENIADDDEIDIDEEESEEDQEKRLIKLMGSLMFDFSYIDTNDLAKGIGFFVN